MKRVFFVGLFCGLTAIATFCQQYNQVIPEKDWVMAPEAATAYVMSNVHPILDKVVRDRHYPPGISERVTTLFNAIGNKQIIYYAEPFYHPKSKTMLAHVDWDIKQGKPVLMVFVPALKDAQAEAPYKSAENWELLLAVTYAHEEVHIERDKYHPMKLRAGTYAPQIAAQDEAETWGITILEMIRPAIEQHRWVPDNWQHNSEELKKADDNYDHPGWIKAFINYPGQ